MAVTAALSSIVIGRHKASSTPAIMKWQVLFEDDFCRHSYIGDHKLICLGPYNLKVVSLVLVALAIVNYYCFLFLHGEGGHTSSTSRSRNDWQNPQVQQVQFKSPTAFRSDICAVINSQAVTGTESRTCDIYRGRWLPDLHPSLYTNDTCRYIFDNQDCLTNGRPDREFLQWRWKPNGCELPRFNPRYFLEAVRGKQMLFTGDSIARNHMQSLLCSLSQVEKPRDAGISKWAFESYNFMVALSWSTFLVNYTSEPLYQLWKLQLDKPDDAWARDLDSYDYVILSTGNWFFRNSQYYYEGKLMGKYNPEDSTSDIGVMLKAMELVWATVTKMLWDYKGVAIVRTATVAHFSDNAWNKGGTCNTTRPDVDEMEKGNTELPWATKQMYTIEKQAVERTTRMKFMDVTYNSLWRPDGHPGQFRIQVDDAEPRHDCVHWCLPGPIDSWNQLLYQIILPFSSCANSTAFSATA